MEDKIEKLLFSPNESNVELALILAKNEALQIENLPAVRWVIKHVFKLDALPKGFEIDAELISRFMSKRTIKLAGNLGHIPSNLYRLNHIIKLSLDFENHDGCLSNAVSNLENLNILQIKNYPSKLPSNLNSLKKLKSLEITNCPDINENDSIWKTNWLERLEIENCQLTTIPSSIQTFKNLDYLSIQDNPIKELPNTLLNLKKLKFVSCHQCKNLEISPIQIKAFNDSGIVVLK